MVPSQKASMSASSRPGTEATASVVASVRRSSTPLSHNSPKRVQPMPMTATWSRMPLLPIALRSLLLDDVLLDDVLLDDVLLDDVVAPGAGAGLIDGRPRLPEVIVHALGRPHAPEG